MATRLKIFLATMAIMIMATLICVGSIPLMAYAQSSTAAAEVAALAANPNPEVNQESGFRLPLLKREDIDDYGKKVYDQMFGPGGRLLAGIRGPSGIRLYSPKVAELEYSLSQYLRYQSGLSGPIRELVILVTAREMDNQFEWTAHEPQGLKDGLPQAMIDVVKYRRGVEGLPETEAVVMQLGRQIFGEKRVDSDIFARALKIFGPKRLVEIVILMGHYSSTAVLLRAFDMQLAPEQKPLLPLP